MKDNYYMIWESGGVGSILYNLNEVPYNIDIIHENINGRFVWVAASTEYNAVSHANFLFEKNKDVVR